MEQFSFSELHWRELRAWCELKLCIANDNLLCILIGENFALDANWNPQTHALPRFLSVLERTSRLMRIETNRMDWSGAETELERTSRLMRIETIPHNGLNFLVKIGENFALDANWNEPYCSNQLSPALLERTSRLMRIETILLNL